ncbi:MAG: hypothetical protein L0216_12340, partial [Planctomycetales bacterium]|nr:hypothetical protein [Planctomycetales bacterium]
MRRILALDLGTGSVRAALVDPAGRLSLAARRPLALRTPRPGWVEADPEAILAAARGCVAAAERGGEAAGLAIASQRSTVVAWDARSGRPLAPALSWQDVRAAPLLARLPVAPGWIRARTGLLPSPHYSAPKLLWLLRNSRAVRRAAAAGRLRVGPLPTFLLWRATGGRVFATDPTLAARTLLLSLARLDWDPDLLRLFRIPPEALPEVRPTAAALAEATLGRTPLPVLAVAGDQQAAFVG